MTDTASSADSPSAACARFCRYADYVHGMYLDATVGMGGMASWYIDMQKQRWKQFEDAAHPITEKEFNPDIVYGGSIRGADGDLHRTTAHDIITRNSPGGSNWQFLGLMCVVGLYSAWDEHFRDLLAKALGKNKEDLKADIFGEVRHLRNAIIHRVGYASPEVAKARLLRAFPEGTPIILEPQDMHDLIDLMKEGARSFAAPSTPAA